MTCSYDSPQCSPNRRDLHGWTDRQVELSIGRLRDDVEDAKIAGRGYASPATSPARRDVSLEQPVLLTPGANLHARLAELAVLLRGQPRLRAEAK
jgi:hypothetical protein